MATPPRKQLPNSAAPAIDSQPSLKAISAGHLDIGCAVHDTQRLSPKEQQLLLHHFSSITAENVMKPEPIHPEPQRYRFEPVDAMVGFCEQHALKLIGHTLAWHQQSPAWFFETGDDGLSPKHRLSQHIAEVVGRYAGRLHAWDVVNEAVADTAANGEYLRDTPWLRALGEDYLIQTFKEARKADPKARLYYNDYNLERRDKRARALKLLQRLLDAGADVSGVGIQGHWILDQVPFEEIEQSIEQYAALGLEVMFTELDLDVIDRPDCSADLDVQRAYSLEEDLYRDGCPPDVLARQAEQYAQLFQLFRQHPAVTRVTFWGLHDGQSWLNHWPGTRTNHPLLFDRALNPKPAFWQLVG